MFLPIMLTYIDLNQFGYDWHGQEQLKSRVENDYE